jgi:hypothetical protein
MRQARTAYAIATVVALVVLSASRPARAIPAFGRRYGVPCATCHSAITRRNEFGDAFRKAGYRWPGLVDERAGTAPIEMRGVSAMRTLLPAQLPVALATTMGAAYTNDPGAEDAVTLGRPTLNILFGGTFGEHVSLFGTWSGSGPPDELVVHFARPWGRPELNFRVGLIEPTTTLFKTNEALIAKFITGTSALNGFALSKSRMGVEANGIIFKRGFWAAGVVQDAGVNSPYDAYYHVGMKLGGMDFLGNEPNIDLEHPSAIDDISFSVAHWGYAGKVETATGEPVSSVHRFGIDAKLTFRDASLLGGAMLGDDRNLQTFVDDRSVTFFGEISYPLTSWLIPSYMYQFQDAESFKQETQRHDIGVIVLPLENLRVRAKYTFTDDNAKNEEAELQVFLAF